MKLSTAEDNVVLRPYNNHYLSYIYNEFILMGNRFLEVLSGNVVSPPPVWLMRQAGRYLPEYRALRQTCRNFLDFCYTPDLTVEATLQPLRRYDFDAAILFSDILVIPHALGQEISFQENIGPLLTPLQRLEDLPPFDEKIFLEKIEPVFETLRRLSRVLPASKALIGFAGAPWTLFAYMIEGKGSRTFAKALEFWMKHPGSAREILNRLCEALEIYLKAQVKAGAQVLQLFDSWAGAVPFPLLDDLVYQPTQRILSTLAQEAPEVPVLCFPKGLGDKALTYVQRTGARALSLDAHIDIEALISRLPSNFPLQGALDPHILICGGELLKTEIQRFKKIFHRRPYVFNLGHGILPSTPPAHVDLLLQYLREDLS